MGRAADGACELTLQDQVLFEVVAVEAILDDTAAQFALPFCDHSAHHLHYKRL